ncbi:MAG: SAM-dependent methyltransferase, partial [Cyanobacteria bacterium J06656_5]
MTQQAEMTRTMEKSLQNAPKCLFCETPLEHTLVDLGMSPLCESILSADKVNQMEAFYPLHVRVCSNCFLAQLEAYVSAEDIFTEYAYFSSYSDTWLAQCKAYTEQVIQRFNLNEQSHVVELASNDGYLLQYFVEKNIPGWGSVPATNVAQVAGEIGVPTL